MTEAAAEKPRFVVLVLQLVVIPLAVVLFCVGLGALFMWMTAERKDFDDYMNALRSSRGGQRSQEARFLLNYIQESKRWQGIFDVTAQMSGDPDEFLAQHPDAVVDLVQVFEESQTQDPKARRYLALVLGLLGSEQAVPALLGGLDDRDPETVKNCLWALGRLGADAAVGRAIELTAHEESSVRLMAVYVLGAFDDPQARELLVAALNDPDELVQWNAAFALARTGQPSARPVLQRLLDKTYVDRFTEITGENRSRYRVAAVTLLARMDDVAGEDWLQELSDGDPDLRVRNAALRALQERKSDG